MEGFKEAADFRTVIQRENEFAPDLMQLFLQFNKVGFAEIEAVKLTVPVRRIGTAMDEFRSLAVRR